MPVEGISMISVFSLLAVSIAIAMSIMIGSKYISPSLDIEKIMSSVAYDIATMYDLAYTLPGEVEIRYYGPSVCEWNRNQPSDSAASFHCFSGRAVVIDSVKLDNDRLYVQNDTYVIYDYNHNEGVSPESVFYPSTAFGDVKIRYFNAQLCSYDEARGTLDYCSEAYAPFASSYDDLDFNTLSKPVDVKVEDYSFVASKKNAGDYYFTISDNPSSYDSLMTFLNTLSYIYSELCHGKQVSGYISCHGSPIADFSDSDTFLTLPRGARWRIYNNSKLCQERISSADGEAYYVPDYCFDISLMNHLWGCDNVPIFIDSSFSTHVNDTYTYYASLSSCLKPYFDVNGGTITIMAGDAKYNGFTGECQ